MTAATPSLGGQPAGMSATAPLLASSAACAAPVTRACPGSTVQPAASAIHVGDEVIAYSRRGR